MLYSYREQLLIEKVTQRLSVCNRQFGCTFRCLEPGAPLQGHTVFSGMFSDCLMTCFIEVVEWY